MSPPPFVSIAMPCLDERDHVEACLWSVLAQDYPQDRIEVLVADGGSTDGTRSIVERIAAEDPRVRLVHSPRRIQASGMNEAIRRSRGDVIVRMDVHCLYAPDYVSRCVEALERTGAWNVGGAQRTRAETPFQRALCAALESYLGFGGASYRRADRDGFVDTVFLGAFRRDAFEQVGLYDPGAITNEDAELNHRIRSAGGSIYLSREIVVEYTPRASHGKLARQYFRYGRGRARTVLKHRTLRPLRSLFPFLATVAGAALLGSAWLHPFTPWAVGAYLAITGSEAFRVARPMGLRHVPLVWSLFPLMHAAHGIGFAAGLVQYGARADWNPPERLAPRPARAPAHAPNPGVQTHVG
jgi:glycosyltransferase involved in cell wall biosynthesis